MGLIQLPTGYVERIATCLKMHSMNLPRGVKLAQDYIGMIADELLAAVENIEATQTKHPEHQPPEGITVEWCEANLAFAVSRASTLIECFPTYAEAKRFANEQATGVAHDEAATETRN